MNCSAEEFKLPTATLASGDRTELLEAEVGRGHKLRLRIGTIQGDCQQPPQIEFVVGGYAIESADANVRLATIAVLVAVEVVRPMFKQSYQTLRDVERAEGVLD